MLQRCMEASSEMKGEGPMGEEDMGFRHSQGFDDATEAPLEETDNDKSSNKEGCNGGFILFALQ